MGMQGQRGQQVRAIVEGHELAERARYLEELGYADIWSGDTIGRLGITTPDSISILSIAAASTTRVELGTCILQVPLRYPVELAHRVLTLHEIAAHRFMLGVGAGSTPVDFAAVGVDFDARFAIMRSSLETMRALWNGETVGSACLHPSESALGGPRVFIGSWGGKWVERAARDFDGWIGTGRGRTWGEMEKAARRFHDLGGTRAVLASIHCDLSQRRPATRFDCINFECSPKEAGRRLQRLEDIGFTDVSIINVGAPEDVSALAEHFA